MPADAVGAVGAEEVIQNARRENETTQETKIQRRRPVEINKEAQVGSGVSRMKERGSVAHVRRRRRRAQHATQHDHNDGDDE